MRQIALSPEYHPSIRMDVYRDNVHVASNMTSYALTAADTDTAHDWEIHLSGSAVDSYFVQIF